MQLSIIFLTSTLNSSRKDKNNDSIHVHRSVLHNDTAKYHMTHGNMRQ